jgi:hypothetical protein
MAILTTRRGNPAWLWGTGPVLSGRSRAKEPVAVETPSVLGPTAVTAPAPVASSWNDTAVRTSLSR